MKNQNEIQEKKESADTEKARTDSQNLINENKGSKEFPSASLSARIRFEDKERWEELCSEIGGTKSSVFQMLMDTYERNSREFLNGEALSSCQEFEAICHTLYLRYQERCADVSALKKALETEKDRRIESYEQTFAQLTDEKIRLQEQKAQRDKEILQKNREIENLHQIVDTTSKASSLSEKALASKDSYISSLKLLLEQEKEKTKEFELLHAKYSHLENTLKETKETNSRIILENQHLHNEADSFIDTAKQLEKQISQLEESKEAYLKLQRENRELQNEYSALELTVNQQKEEFEKRLERERQQHQYEIEQIKKETALSEKQNAVKAEAKAQEKVQELQDKMLEMLLKFSDSENI